MFAVEITRYETPATSLHFLPLSATFYHFVPRFYAASFSCQGESIAR